MLTFGDDRSILQPQDSFNEAGAKRPRKSGARLTYSTRYGAKLQ